MTKPVSIGDHCCSTSQHRAPEAEAAIVIDAVVDLTEKDEVSYNGSVDAVNARENDIIPRQVVLAPADVIAGDEEHNVAQLVPEMVHAVPEEVLVDGVTAISVLDELHVVRPPYVDADKGERFRGG